MSLAIPFEKGRYRLIVFLLCISFLLTGCMRFSKQKPGEKPDLSQPRQSFYSGALDRLNSGFMNILSGPAELLNQPREEIKRTNPIRGLLPGMFKGVTWLTVREVVGVFEVGTFFVPLKPHLEPINTEWLTL